MVNVVNYSELVRVAIVQTRLNAESSWKSGPPIAKDDERRAVAELRSAFRTLSALPESERPQFILIPELSVPRGFASALRKLACGISAVVIAGLDYKFVQSGNEPKRVRNEALIIVPKEWQSKRFRKGTNEYSVSKMYAAPRELCLLMQHSIAFEGSTVFWMIEAGKFGRIGICICYDFMDVERFVLYRGSIQHLFVVAYNKDTETFLNLAHTLSKTLFCNVVVCNTGRYGGSVAVTPKHHRPLRLLYQHGGNNLSANQVVALPVKELISAQMAIPNCNPLSTGAFRPAPPGFQPFNRNK